jgi:hypothetical protein
MADIMMEVAFSASVTSLATAIAGLHDELEGPSAVDCKGNLTNLRRELHSSLAKGNPK